MPELSTNRIRVIGLIHPKEGISHEEFSTYWLNTHSQVFLSLPVVQRNILKYEQYHFNQTVNAQLAALGTHLPSAHGLAILEAESLDKLMEIFADPEFAEKVAPDEERFLDRTLTEAAATNYVTFVDKSA
ncbi:hypothetical protein EUX98_g5670 [Antrodiella citrinella]|uniref:EthD domain-containing protein n=1 Tax=Antrodiella citrinella TaxID=2447956 RepID=A0A4S4MR76_9APHY|nr:hypothetical protein EUX98_g5670 [Antrodiella citrinella]